MLSYIPRRRPLFICRLFFIKFIGNLSPHNLTNINRLLLWDNVWQKRTILLFHLLCFWWKFPCCKVVHSGCKDLLSFAEIILSDWRIRHIRSFLNKRCLRQDMRFRNLVLFLHSDDITLRIFFLVNHVSSDCGCSGSLHLHIEYDIGCSGSGCRCCLNLLLLPVFALRIHDPTTLLRWL